MLELFQSHGVDWMRSLCIKLPMHSVVHWPSVVSAHVMLSCGSVTLLHKKKGLEATVTK